MYLLCSFIALICWTSGAGHFDLIVILFKEISRFLYNFSIFLAIITILVLQSAKLWV